MPSHIYNLRDVEKTRVKGGTAFTLRVPELTVHPGEFWAIVGPSGCGKSTLLDLLALVLSPSNVTRFEINLQWNGTLVSHNIVDLSDNKAAMIRRNFIGYILQNGGLLPFLTVKENILVMAGIGNADISTSDFDSLIDVLGLGDQLKKKPQYLSGGQRQRVAVARALISRPCIVLADEPTAAVDSQTAVDILEELRSLASGLGSAVMMVTHDRSLVETVSDTFIEFHLTRKSINESIAVTSISKPVSNNKKTKKDFVLKPSMTET